MWSDVCIRIVLSGNIENVPIKEKAKFPQHFFPEFKWSRKGFLRTRWSVNNCIFDLINIHLFHDASNIVAMESSPSLYAGNRQRALLHTLQRFENDKYSKVPLFIFGDFNFRLDSNMLIKELTTKLVASQTKGKKDAVNKIEYTEEGNGKLHQYDAEVLSFRDRLFEYDISFPPSYPFCEDVTDGISYMKTRVPSWCDRVLLSHASKDVVNQDPCHLPVYDLMGKDVCMGDHKPVYLFVLMKPGKGNPPAQLERERDIVVEPGLQQLHMDDVVEAKTIPLPDSRSLTPESPSEYRRPRTLSINGEMVAGLALSLGSDADDSQGVDWSLVNIHDYATFEQEKYLIPEFRNSIKKLEGGEEQTTSSTSNLLEPEKPGMRRKRSFKEMASKVRTMEKVLRRWPGRPRSRHHSSSSEDFSQSESEASSRGKPVSLGISDAEGEKASETTSVDTVSVDFSPSKALFSEDGLEKHVFPGSDNNNYNNNNNETYILQDCMQDREKNTPTLNSVEVETIKAVDSFLTDKEEEDENKGNGGVEVKNYGLRNDRRRSGGYTTTSQVAAASGNSIGVSCTGDVDVVVAPLHEAEPIMAVEVSRGPSSSKKPAQEEEKKKQRDAVAQLPLAQGNKSEAPEGTTTTTTTSTSCCGYCRCVVL
ncbi:type i inositol-1,4,5-trisphosphate 5-phosphatase [Plakobranchus ocellatus]|uniref:inositol-polyphosphate 5-phosphatase n=1 Tax=Plakobranchus ocellatus TaxID=259542 RepID=A0AAV3XX66_9GAST|nr:type i inositol-1,4,5-trisphosphate 5-phosphatase [Plakobranchus ocellatus]